MNNLFELTPHLNHNELEMTVVEDVQTTSPFILGNTQEMDIEKLRQNYLVPVFSRDNCETISHSEFISTVMDAAQTFFEKEQFLSPQIRVSHEMKLRTRTGAGKLVENLEEQDSGAYFQRMCFMIEIPSIQAEINGCRMNLQIVGVRSYHETNLLGNSSQKQRFRIGVGFVNQVCTNMCLCSEGTKLDINVTNTADLYLYAMEVFDQYNYNKHLEAMKSLVNTEIPVATFAQFLGKARMYSALPQSIKTELQLPEFILPESQINAAVRDYYSDENFGGFGKAISGWKLYNLLTNFKNSYINTTLERNVNAFDVAEGIVKSVNGTDDTWGWFTEQV